MQLFAFGVNHHTAPLSLRERVAFAAERLEDALHDLVHRPGVKEAAILSTCNRTEVYCHTLDAGAPIGWFGAYHGIGVDKVEPYLYRLPEDEAVRHAFRVASGLDSMVLGEAQILGQMKQAVQSAQHAGTLGVLLNKLFQSTFSVAKEVRTSTEIGANSVSMAAAAVRMAERIFPSISRENVLFIGAGEMIELCLAHFSARKPHRMLIANRTAERARPLAERYQAGAIGLSDLPDHLPYFDIIVTSTASPLPLLGKGLLERALKARKHKPFFIVDLAVPRDVEEEAGDLEDVFLYTVDDLGEVVKEGMDARQAQVGQAEAIISSNVRDFMTWLEGREILPVLRSLRDQAERQRRHELDKAIKALHRGDDPGQVLEQFSRGLTNKLLHGPTVALNQGLGEDKQELARMVRRLYDLKPD